MSHPDPSASLPHHRLIAYQLALELVKLVAGTRIRDSQLRPQAERALKVPRAKRDRIDLISRWKIRSRSGSETARQETTRRGRAPAVQHGAEVARLARRPDENQTRAAVEIAGALGACAPAQVAEVLALGVRLKNVLSRLVR